MRSVEVVSRQVRRNRARGGAITGRLHRSWREPGDVYGPNMQPRKRKPGMTLAQYVMLARILARKRKSQGEGK